jgi:hypothetical protein
LLPLYLSNSTGPCSGDRLTLFRRSIGYVVLLRPPTTAVNGTKDPIWYCPSMQPIALSPYHCYRVLSLFLLSWPLLDLQIRHASASCWPLRMIKQCSLRHSFNSALANAGVSREIRQKFTGHASADMNTLYTRHEFEAVILN